MMGLLAAEILAVTGVDPAESSRRLEDKFGKTFLRRSDFPQSGDSVSRLKGLTPADVVGTHLGGDPITDAVTHAPSGAPLGGIKMVTPHGWVAARPSGTEAISKVYGESFESATHLEALLLDGARLIEGERTS